jgi:hypothetical protein
MICANVDPVKNPYTSNAGSLSQIGQRLLEKGLIYATEDCG